MLQCKKIWSTYSFIPPYLIFIFWILLLYFYRGQDTNSSYALSVFVLFVITMWLTKIIFHSDSNVEKHLFYIQLKHRKVYLYLKMIVCLIVLLPLIIFSLVYPIIFNLFDTTITVRELILAILLHIFMVLLAILMTTFVLTICHHVKKLQWPILCLLTLLVISQDLISQQSILFKWLKWVLPPVSRLLSMMSLEDSASLFYLLCHIIVYMIILVTCITIADDKIEVI